MACCVPVALMLPCNQQSPLSDRLPRRPQPQISSCPPVPPVLGSFWPSSGTEEAGDRCGPCPVMPRGELQILLSLAALLATV